MGLMLGGSSPFAVHSPDLQPPACAHAGGKTEWTFRYAIPPNRLGRRGLAQLMGTIRSRSQVVKAISYKPARKREWDDFVRVAKNGHFLFNRDYMEYHSDRFPDASLMFYDGSDRLIGLLPATARQGVVSSHSGLSFGGV